MSEKEIKKKNEEKKKDQVEDCTKPGNTEAQRLEDTDDACHESTDGK